MTRSSDATRGSPLPLPSEAGRPLVIAHRGASGHRPENTMAAYELAVEERADMIEVDLHVSRDGGIPISHDAELERLGGTGEIADCNASCTNTETRSFFIPRPCNYHCAYN